MRSSAGEMLIQDSEPGNLIQPGPAPSDRPAGAALSADLVEEQASRASDDAVIVRLGDSPATVQLEGHGTPVSNGGSQSAIDFVVH